MRLQVFCTTKILLDEVYMIDLTVNKEGLEKSLLVASERGVVIPTFSQMVEPGLIPQDVKSKLGTVGMWEVDPCNLFRISWYNEPVESGGGFGGPNFIEFPRSLTGVEAKIVAMVGKWFPTGAHKVGAAFGCLVPRLVTGQFNPIDQKSVWPSTGNYCRGGAYDAALLGCESVAILPEGMSQERFEWLENIAGEVIKTPGTESNVKEIFDKCWELRSSGENLMIFNQFEEFGNYLWHYHVTGRAIADVMRVYENRGFRLAGLVGSTGSAGTIASGDYLKECWPLSKIAVSEALQCPTLLMNGFGSHRIEGIGDKHVPWIHNVKNTDMVIAVDDEAAMNVSRLFNEIEGIKYLEKQGVDNQLLGQLPLAGISGVSNLISAIKFAKWYELGSEDVVMTVLTDGMELYNSRLAELNDAHGRFTEMDAHLVYGKDVIGATTDYMAELDYYGKKRIHNLKYFTWVEQQGKTYDEIQAQWYEDSYWRDIRQSVEPLDSLITEFNRMSGATLG